MWAGYLLLHFIAGTAGAHRKKSEYIRTKQYLEKRGLERKVGLGVPIQLSAAKEI